MAYRGSVVSIASVSPTCNFSGTHLRHAYSQRDIHCTGLQSKASSSIPLSTISAEELLSSDTEFSGFLYKRSSRTDRLTSAIQSKINLPFIPKWQLRYVILYKDWLYYFNSERSKRPKGAFCLKGYHRVMRADEAAGTDQRYAFKIMGPSHNMRTYFFGAACEREMTLWMAHIRVTMEKAIHGSARDRSIQLLEDLKRKNERAVSQVREFDERTSFRRDSITSTGSYHDQIYDEIEKQLPLYDDTDTICALDIGDRPLPRPPAECSPDSVTTKYQVPKQPPVPVKRKPDVKDKHHSKDLNIRSSTSFKPKVPFGFRLPSLDSEDDDEENEQEGETDASNNADFLIPSHQPHSRSSTQIHKTVPSRPEPARRRTSEDERLGTPKGQESSRQKNTEHEKSGTPQGLRRRPDGNSFRGKHEETKLKKPPAPLKKPQILPKPNILKLTATYNKVGAIKDILPDSAIFESSDKVKAEEMLKKSKVDGMYLMRNSAQEGQKVLMVYHGNGKCKHYKIFGDGVINFSLDKSPVFNNMTDLIEHYTSNGLPNTDRVLTKPFHE